MRKLGCLGIALAFAAIAAMFLVAQTWSGAGPLAKPGTIAVPQGATLTSTAASLEKAGAIASADRFLLMAKLLGSSAPIQAGEYELPAGVSQSDLLELLQSGRTLQRMIVVPEGTPSIVVHERLMAEPLLTGEVAALAEGSVLPDSYAFQRGDTRAKMVNRMQTAMRDYLADAWKKRKPGIAVSTPEQAIILASIVEKETGVPAERRTVAAVYTNRLKRGMPLQADPTVIYPVTKGKPLGRRILRSELMANNGYNTYAMAGLPNGPIANPGRESIAAVLDPAQSSALYFVADGSGGHVFADTLEQHNANVQKWYAIRRQRGEM